MPFKYTLIEKIGQGSYGSVWRARSEKHDDFIAVKELDLQDVPKKRVERVLIELETMNKLRGEPNIVQFYAVEQKGKSLLLGMQLCEGGTLRQYLTKCGSITTRDEVIRITCEICNGLSALRRLDLVHRDLKPSNVLFHGGTVMLGDFGMVARISEGDTATRVCGTIRYMAPEMITQQKYDHRVDLWGLGLILHEMMVGKHPFLEWADESTCDNVTDAMTKLLFNIVQCRAPGSNTTEVQLPHGLPFHFFIGEDSPARVMHGLLQESPQMRWSFEKLCSVLGVRGRSASIPIKTRHTNNASQLSTETIKFEQPAERTHQEATRSIGQRKRLLQRRSTAESPDGTVTQLLESTPISQVALARDKLVVMYSDDSCLDALRTLLKFKISSAPVLKCSRQEANTIDSGAGGLESKASSEKKNYPSVVLGFVDVLDLVSIIIQYHQNPCLSAIDALVSNLSLACNFSGNNPYMRLEVSDSLTVADAMPLLVGGAKRLAVTDRHKGIVSVLTQSQVLRWLMDQLMKNKAIKGERDLSIQLSNISQKVGKSIESLGLCRYWRRKDDGEGSRIIVIRSNETVASAFLLLAENHLSAAPVVDTVSGAIIGVFSASDINRLPSFDARADGQDQEAAARVASAFGSLNKLNSTVLEYISSRNRGAVTVVSSDSILTACELLGKHLIHRCYLVEEGSTPRPYGVVSIADILHVFMQPCNVFDAAKCRQALCNLRARVEKQFPLCLPYRHLFVESDGLDEGSKYVDDPFSPNAFVHVVGTQMQHGKLEISLNVVSLPNGGPFSSEIQHLPSTSDVKEKGEDTQQRTQTVERLCTWAVNEELRKHQKHVSDDAKNERQEVSIMYRALNRSLWPDVCRAMQSHSFTQASLEPCNMYTLSEETYKARSVWSTEPSLMDQYVFHELRPEDAKVVNSTWKFRSESSLIKIKRLIAAGRTMAAFAKGVDTLDQSNTTCSNCEEVPVSWMVTYEDGSIGMLYTQPGHRRKGLALRVARLLVKAHHLPTPDSRPFLYIEIGNHPSLRLFSEKLGFKPEANVAWMRWHLKQSPKLSLNAGVAGASSNLLLATKLSHSDTKPRLFRPKGGLARSHAENCVKWEAWYSTTDPQSGNDALLLPPWDTNGRPCFALPELIDSIQDFKHTYSSVIDIGCGTGSNSVWLAEQGFESVTGIDISPKAIAHAKSRAIDASINIDFRCADIFHIPSSLKGGFDFLVDVQTFHAIYHLDAVGLVRSMASLLRHRGLALVVTGNSGEAQRSAGMGPSVLSREDLTTYFCTDKLFRVAQIRESRFDPTPAYGDEPPLCWVALFVRTGVKI